MTLTAAALYSGHTLLLARMSRNGETFNAYALTVVQLGTIGLLTGALAVRDGITLPAGVMDWAELAHLSVVSCALGFLARSYGQTHVPAVPSGGADVLAALLGGRHRGDRVRRGDRLEPADRRGADGGGDAARGAVQDAGGRAGCRCAGSC